MGFDIHLYWKGMTEEEKNAQYFNRSWFIGYTGYLRSSYEPNTAQIEALEHFIPCLKTDDRENQYPKKGEFKERVKTFNWYDWRHKIFRENTKYHLRMLEMVHEKTDDLFKNLVDDYIKMTVILREKSFIEFSNLVETKLEELGEGNVWIEIK